MWAPPTGEAVEGPAAADEARDVDAIVEAAAQAAKDRAWLERNNKDIAEYVMHLDALANVADDLDTCDSAIRAELRMALALAYLKAVGDCTEAGDTVDAPAEGSDEARSVPRPSNFPWPVLECSEASGPRECADRLLDTVAEFAAQGQGGTTAPFSPGVRLPACGRRDVGRADVRQLHGRGVRSSGRALERSLAPMKRRRLSKNRRKKCGRCRGWASIAGVSGGAAMVIVGAVLLSMDGKCPGGYDPMTDIEECPSVYNTNVAGGRVGGRRCGSDGPAWAPVLAITEVQRKKAGKHRPSALRRKIDRAEALTGLRLSPPPTTARAPSLKSRRSMLQAERCARAAVDRVAEPGRRGLVELARTDRIQNLGGVGDLVVGRLRPGGVQRHVDRRHRGDGIGDLERDQLEPQRGIDRLGLGDAVADGRAVVCPRWPRARSSAPRRRSGRSARSRRRSHARRAGRSSNRRSLRPR